MPPSSHSLFKQQRRQKLRLILVLFLSIPLIVEIKSHYYYAVDDDGSTARPFVPRRGNEMEQHLQQLSQRVIIDGNDNDDNDATRGDANARTVLPLSLIHI